MCQESSFHKEGITGALNKKTGYGKLRRDERGSNITGSLLRLNVRVEPKASGVVEYSLVMTILVNACGYSNNPVM